MPRFALLQYLQAFHPEVSTEVEPRCQKMWRVSPRLCLWLFSPKRIKVAKCADAASSPRFRPTQESIKDVPVRFFFSALVSTLPSAPTLGNSTLKEEEMMSQQRARLNGSPLIPHWLTSGQVAASQGQHQVHLQQLFSFSYLDMSSRGYADSTMFCKTWLQMSITETKRDSQSMQNLTMVLLRLMADGDRNKHFDCLLTDLMYVCSTHMAPHFFVL